MCGQPGKECSVPRFCLICLVRPAAVGVLEGLDTDIIDWRGKWAEVDLATLGIDLPSCGKSPLLVSKESVLTRNTSLDPVLNLRNTYYARNPASQRHTNDLTSCCLLLSQLFMESCELLTVRQARVAWLGYEKEGAKKRRVLLQLRPPSLSNRTPIS